MKTLLLILILCLPVSAQIGGHIELGKDLYSDMSYTDIRIDYDFTFWNVHLIPYGNQITWFCYDKFKGYPFRDIYVIGIESKYDGIVFGAEHYCSHAVSSGSTIYRKPDEPPLAYDLTKWFVRYEF